MSWREEGVEGGRKKRLGCQKCPLEKPIVQRVFCKEKGKKWGIKSKYIVYFGKGIAFMCPVFQGTFPFSEQKWGTKETFGHFCLLCSGAAGRLAASGSHKSSPEMRLKYAPLAHNPWGGEKAAWCSPLPSHSRQAAVRWRLQPGPVQSPLAKPVLMGHQSYFPQGCAHLLPSFHVLRWLTWRGLSANKHLGHNQLPLSASPSPESPSSSSCVSKCNCVQENPSL